MIAAPILPPEFSELDRHFATFIGRFGGGDGWVPCAAGALSQSVREGHVCLNLADLSASLAEAGSPDEIARWPSVAEWKSELSRSAAVGSPDAATPLVLDRADRLYLRRFWNYQARLAQNILARCAHNPNPARSAPVEVTQDGVVAAALRNNLTIICGGPGTGKTSTVVRILSSLIDSPGGEHLRLALTAPTGKAASRLEEAVRDGAAVLAADSAGHQLGQQGAKTIHRLLERRGRSGPFRYHRENPLPLDVLIVDEASMVALPLLSKLFDALPPACRVVLLGDRDQLASVEPGAVLADMVDAAAIADSPLSGSVMTLHTNYRFSSDSAIQRVCSAVRAGDTATAVALLRANEQRDLVATETTKLAAEKEKISTAARRGFAAAVSARDPASALAALKQFRVLTPLRQGPWGVTGLTDLIEDALLADGLISGRGTAPYAGKPILILQNDYDLELYNGDLGVLLPDTDKPAESDQLYGWFLGKENSLRRFAQARLPEHATAYAMTVHKSQGSEFEQIQVILPEIDSPLMTRELIYTALTRARSTVNLFWNAPVLSAAIERRRKRESGLCDLLTAG